MLGRSRKLCIFLTFFAAIFTIDGVEIVCLGEECDYFINGSTCIDSKCVCEKGYIVSANGTKCLQVADGYGVACYETVQCSATLGPGASCISGSCSCGTGYHYLRGKCWKSVNLNETCFRDEQCYAAHDFTGLECKENICSCRDTFYLRAGSCRQRRNEGESCVLDSDCDCVGGSCITHLCQCSNLSSGNTLKAQQGSSPLLMDIQREGPCPPGFFSDNEDCVPEIGSACNSSEDKCSQGVSNSACIDNKLCGCDATRIRSANNRACSKVAQSFGGPCSGDEACITFGADSVCQEQDGIKQCGCRNGSHFDAESQYCRRNHLIGEPCEEGDCYTTSGAGVTCLNGKCSCVLGTHSADMGRDCRPDGLDVGDACQEKSDCFFDFSDCNEELLTCQCAMNYFLSNHKCLAGLGAICSDDKDCSAVPTASCSNTICACQPLHVPSNDSSSCLPLKEEGENCVQDNECNPSMGELRTCENGRCGCIDGAQFILGRCYIKRQLGEKCSARAECVQPGYDPAAYMCQNGFCACQYGHRREDEHCV